MWVGKIWLSGFSDQSLCINIFVNFWKQSQCQLWNRKRSLSWEVPKPDVHVLVLDCPSTAATPGLQTVLPDTVADGQWMVSGCRDVAPRDCSPLH